MFCGWGSDGEFPHVGRQCWLVASGVSEAVFGAPYIPATDRQIVARLPYAADDSSAPNCASSMRYRNANPTTGLALLGFGLAGSHCGGGTHKSGVLSACAVSCSGTGARDGSPCAT